MNTIRLSTLALLLSIALSGCISEAPDHQQASYSELAAFELLPSEQALHVYQSLSADEQRVLWEQQLERDLTNLQGEERRFAEQVLSNFDDAWSHPEAYEAAATEVMGETRMKELFSTLGSLEEGLRPSNAGEVIQDGDFQTIQLPHEACSNRWGCGRETIRHYCTDTRCEGGCATTSSGCGWFLMQSCNSVVAEVTDC